MKIQIKTTKEIEVNPELLAQVFSEMTNTEQAEFFEECAKLWEDKDFDSQMASITNLNALSLEAAQIMNTIGKNSGLATPNFS
jgi:NADPH:quinone reductase-like Zn-dependent oxidoreductase